MERAQNLYTADPVARMLLAFWFGEAGSLEYGQPRAIWFQKDPSFDAAISQQFGALHQAACQGKWDKWQQHPATKLGLILLFDQFSRHLYRHSQEAFAQDDKALNLALNAIEQGFDQQVMPVARVFYYLPLEHSENLAHQQQALELFARLQAQNTLYTPFTEYARKHYEVIAQFGRFPHRNKLLGRISSAAEQAYLDQPGAGF
jgi:uncharacterized protein (DUF924 family)